MTAQNEAAVNKIVQRESGWNPNITNNWDSNARAGHPSTGLMQTIPSTFKQYAIEGYNTNIHDPLSNLVAGIRYAQARYARGGESGVAVVASRSGGY
ncbi:MAG TPA: transglycosylase SLT domain-containing protein [Trichormus sp.]